MEKVYELFLWTWELKGIWLLLYHLYLFSVVIVYGLALFSAFVDLKFCKKMWLILTIQIIIFCSIGLFL